MSSSRERDALASLKEMYDAYLDAVKEATEGPRHEFLKNSAIAGILLGNEVRAYLDAIAGTQDRGAGRPTFANPGKSPTKGQ